MRKSSWIFAILLTIAGAAEAQQSDASRMRKKWDAAVTVAAAEVKPGQNDTLYWDNWFFQGRYAVQIGGYWTEHLKTEVEYAKFGEGSIMIQDFKRFPGSPYVYPYAYESLHQLDQLQLRMTYQFGENSWVHPYVSAGVFGARDNKGFHTEQQFLSPTGRAQDRVMVVDNETSRGRYDFDLGFTGAAGAKMYLSRNAFVNAGFNGTFGQQKTMNMFAGVGIDF